MRTSAISLGRFRLYATLKLTLTLTLLKVLKTTQRGACSTLWLMPWKVGLQRTRQLLKNSTM